MSTSAGYEVAADLMMRSNIPETMPGIIEAFEKLDKVIRESREGIGSFGKAFEGISKAASKAAESASSALSKGADQGALAQERAADRATVAAERAAEKQQAASDRTAISQEKAADRAYNAMFAAAEKENAARDAASERQSAAIARVAAAQEKAADRAYTAMYNAAQREDELRDRQTRSIEVADANAMNASHDRAVRASASHGVTSMEVNMAAGEAAHAGESALEHGYHSSFDPRYYEYQLTTDSAISPERAHQAYDKAFDATNSAPGTTPGENMHTLYDITSLTGDLGEAEASLPAAARLMAVLKATSLHSTGDENQGFAAFKTLEILGKLTKESVDPKTGEKKKVVDAGQLVNYSEAIARVDVQTGGRVTPEDYLGYAKQGRVGALQEDDRFTFHQLPALLSVLGGQRTGTAINSANSIFEGGHETEKTMQAMIDAGLAGKDGLRTVADKRHPGKTKTEVNYGAIHHSDELKHNMVEYIRLVTADLERAGKSKDEIFEILQRISQRGPVGGTWGDIYANQAAIDKEEARGNRILQNTDANPDPMGQYLKDNPLAKTQQFSAAIDKLFAALGGPLMDPALAALGKLTDGLNAFSNWSKDNPIAAKAIGLAIAAGTAIAGALAAVSGAMMIYGPLIKAARVAAGIGEVATTAGAAALPVAATAAEAAAASPAALAVGIGAAAYATYKGATMPFGVNDARTRDLAASKASPRSIAAFGEPVDGIEGYGTSVAPRPSDLAPAANSGPQDVRVINPGDLARANIANLARQANKPDSTVTGFDATGSTQPSVNSGLQ